MTSLQPLLPSSCLLNFCPLPLGELVHVQQIEDASSALRYEQVFSLDPSLLIPVISKIQSQQRLLSFLPLRPLRTPHMVQQSNVQVGVVLRLVSEPQQSFGLGNINVMVLVAESGWLPEVARPGGPLGAH